MFQERILNIYDQAFRKQLARTLELLQVIAHLLHELLGFLALGGPGAGLCWERKKLFVSKNGVMGFFISHEAGET